MIDLAVGYQDIWIGANRAFSQYLQHPVAYCHLSGRSATGPGYGGWPLGTAFNTSISPADPYRILPQLGLSRSSTNLSLEPGRIPAQQTAQRRSLNLPGSAIGNYLRVTALGFPTQPGQNLSCLGLLLALSNSFSTVQGQAAQVCAYQYKNAGSYQYLHQGKAALH
jgi:hypothetical protein